MFDELVALFPATEVKQVSVSHDESVSFIDLVEHSKSYGDKPNTTAKFCLDPPAQQQFFTMNSNNSFSSLHQS
jgi:hypothetical protein